MPGVDRVRLAGEGDLDSEVWSASGDLIRGANGRDLR